MKKFVLGLILLMAFTFNGFSQTINQELRNQIDRIVANDVKNWSNSTFKHNVTIRDVKEDGQTITIYGTYDYSNFWEGTVSIDYTATAKIVLQEVTVQKVCWYYHGSTTCAR